MFIGNHPRKKWMGKKIPEKHWRRIWSKFSNKTLLRIFRFRERYPKILELQISFVLLRYCSGSSARRTRFPQPRRWRSQAEWRRKLQQREVSWRVCWTKDCNAEFCWRRRPRRRAASWGLCKKKNCTSESRRWKMRSSSRLSMLSSDENISESRRRIRRWRRVRLIVDLVRCCWPSCGTPQSP